MTPQQQRALERLLRRQDGVISRAQALDAGLSARTIDRRLASRQWRSAGPRVYRAADHAETPRSRVLAAMLSLGDGATLVGRSAAWWWRLGTPLPTRVEVAVDGSRRPERRLEVEVTRRTIVARDRTVVAGVAVTTRPLSVLDACARLGLVEGARLMDGVLLKGTVSLEALRDVHLRHGGRRGARLVRALLVLAAGGARSHAERLAHRVLRAAGIAGWVANLALSVPGHGRVVGDIVFADLRVIVEVDGWAFHRDQDAFRRDAARQNALVAAGWGVIRTNWYQLMEEPEVFVAALRRTLTAKI